MTDTINEIIPYAFLFIFIIFLLAKKESKKINANEKIDRINIHESEKIELLKNAESKLIALRDLYKQELIDANIYLKKTELVVKKVSKEIGNDIMDYQKLRQKEIFKELKNEIKKKTNEEYEINAKTDIDNLISAVDKKIKSGIIDEKKQL